MNRSGHPGVTVGGNAARQSGLPARVVVLFGLALLALGAEATGEGSPCAEAAVCVQSSSPPADDWFRQGLEALAANESVVATCSLEKASELDPDEDGHNLSTFVKPMLGGVRLPLRECSQSSAPLDKKKYFPSLYLAKAYFDWAQRSGDAEKKEYCKRALSSLAGSRADASVARIRQQLERRERIDRALADSRCCDLVPEDLQCSALNGSSG